jgi:hypothetical protein
MDDAEHLELDPDESYDVSAKHPEVTARLRASMAEWEEAMAANPRGWR